MTFFPFQIHYLAFLFLFSISLCLPTTAEAGLLKDVIKSVVAGVASTIAKEAYSDMTDDDDQKSDDSSSSSTKDDDDKTSANDNNQEKQNNIANAISSVVEYYHYNSLKDSDSVLKKWADPTSKKAMKAAQLARNGGKCQADDGDIKSYSKSYIVFSLEVVCNEGKARGKRRYNIKFDLQKIDDQWLISDFNSI